MHLEQDLESVGALAPESIDRFREHIPAEWIDESLYATGTATVRHRRLPAVQVVWLVIGMALFRNRSIVEVVDKLNLALPRLSQPRLPVASSAVPQARCGVGRLAQLLAPWPAIRPSCDPGSHYLLLVAVAAFKLGIRRPPERCTRRRCRTCRRCRRCTLHCSRKSLWPNLWACKTDRIDRCLLPCTGRGRQVVRVELRQGDSKDQ